MKINFGKIDRKRLLRNPKKKKQLPLIIITIMIMIMIMMMRLIIIIITIITITIIIIISRHPYAQHPELSVLLPVPSSHALPLTSSYAATLLWAHCARCRH
ncbi:unnamed protein product [Closterium sp. NIES-54]